MFAGAALLMAGCAGPMFEGTIFEAPQQRDPALARISSTTDQVSADVGQLSQQMAGVMRTLEAQEGRLARLEARVGAGVATQEEIVALRRDLQLARAEREALRKEITDDLAARVERLAARQQADARAAAPARASGAAGAAGAARAAAGYEHTVEKGQSLSVIARGYGKSVDAIMKANKLTDASMLRVGQKLFIPD